MTEKDRSSGEDMSTLFIAFVVVVAIGWKTAKAFKKINDSLQKMMQETPLWNESLFQTEPENEQDTQ